MLRHTTFLKSLRTAFISGLLLLAPVGVTVWVIKFLVDLLGAPTREIFFFFLTDRATSNAWFATALNVAATIIVLLLITLLGWVSRLVAGRFLVRQFERVMTAVPIVKGVYGTVKQIIDTFTAQQRAVFQKPVLIEFPRRGIHGLAFITSSAKGEIQGRTHRNLVNVFLPTTPNPTSGFLLMVPEEDILPLTMSVTDAMKIVISGGALVPVWDPKSQAVEEVWVNNPEATPTTPQPQTGRADPV